MKSCNQKPWSWCRQGPRNTSRPEETMPVTGTPSRADPCAQWVQTADSKLTLLQDLETKQLPSAPCLEWALLTEQTLTACCPVGLSSCPTQRWSEAKWSEVRVAQSCPALCIPVDCSPPGSSVHGILQARALEWVAIPFSRGIFLTQGSNPGLPHCRQILHQLSHQGSPRILEWVAYPFSRGSSWPRNQTRVSCIAGRFFLPSELPRKPILPVGEINHQQSTVTWKARYWHHKNYSDTNCPSLSAACYFHKDIT